MRVYGSDRVLSFQGARVGEASVPCAGSQHDERRLRVVHVLAAGQRRHQSDMGDLRPEPFDLSATSFLRSQAGPRPAARDRWTAIGRP